jgi:hypothetical protein
MGLAVGRNLKVEFAAVVVRAWPFVFRPPLDFAQEVHRAAIEEYGLFRCRVCARGVRRRLHFSARDYCSLPLYNGSRMGFGRMVAAGDGIKFTNELQKLSISPAT